MMKRSKSFSQKGLVMGSQIAYIQTPKDLRHHPPVDLILTNTYVRRSKDGPVNQYFCFISLLVSVYHLAVCFMVFLFGHYASGPLVYYLFSLDGAGEEIGIILCRAQFLGEFSFLEQAVEIAIDILAPIHFRFCETCVFKAIPPSELFILIQQHGLMECSSFSFLALLFSIFMVIVLFSFVSLSFG